MAIAASNSIIDRKKLRFYDHPAVFKAKSIRNRGSTTKDATEKIGESNRCENTFVNAEANEISKQNKYQFQELLPAILERNNSIATAKEKKSKEKTEEKEKEKEEEKEEAEEKEEEEKEEEEEEKTEEKSKKEKEEKKEEKSEKER